MKWNSDVTKVSMTVKSRGVTRSTERDFDTEAKLQTARGSGQSRTISKADACCLKSPPRRTPVAGIVRQLLDPFGWAPEPAPVRGEDGENLYPPASPCLTFDAVMTICDAAERALQRESNIVEVGTPTKIYGTFLSLHF